MLKFNYILIGAALIICSCEKEKTILVDEAFQPYVDEFIKEAKERGHDIDFSDTGLTIKFESIVSTAAGICSELGGPHDGEHKIEIARSSWKDFTVQQRKRLIFHELGHCELGRAHNNSVMPNDEWKSIMRGDPIPDDRFVVVNFTGFREEYYIDELFNENTALPEWATRKYLYSDVALGAQVFSDISKKENLSVQFSLDTNRDFQIEFDFSQTGGYGISGFKWGNGVINQSMHYFFYEGDKLAVGSGLAIEDLFYMKRYQNVVSNLSHKFTIRKSQNRYIYFLDENYIYLNDFIPIAIHDFSDFYGSGVKGEFTNFTIHYLN